MEQYPSPVPSCPAQGCREGQSHAPSWGHLSSSHGRGAHGAVGTCGPLTGTLSGPRGRVLWMEGDVNHCAHLGHVLPHHPPPHSGSFMSLVSRADSAPFCPLRCPPPRMSAETFSPSALGSVGVHSLWFQTHTERKPEPEGMCEMQSLAACCPRGSQRPAYPASVTCGFVACHVWVPWGHSVPPTGRACPP